MKIIGLAGWSGAGKTTLLVKLIPLLVARGLAVSTIKHAHHAFDVDQPGKDSYEHRQAGALGAHGETFVLNMGDPVRILDLARDLIRLSGFVPGKQIPIEFTGVRPGEKLYEELLIGENTTGTSHPRIFKNSEPVLAYAELVAALERLDDAIQRQDEAELQDMLRATVEGYMPGSSGLPGSLTDDWQPASRTLH